MDFFKLVFFCECDKIGVQIKEDSVMNEDNKIEQTNNEEKNEKSVKDVAGDALNSVKKYAESIDTDKLKSQANGYLGWLKEHSLNPFHAIEPLTKETKIKVVVTMIVAAIFGCLPILINYKSFLFAIPGMEGLQGFMYFLSESDIFELVFGLFIRLVVVALIFYPSLALLSVWVDKRYIKSNVSFLDCFISYLRRYVFTIFVDAAMVVVALVSFVAPNLGFYVLVTLFVLRSLMFLFIFYESFARIPFKKVHPIYPIAITATLVNAILFFVLNAIF